MAEIVTLTMNPAIDLSTSVERVEPVRKLRCGPARREAGGGGINVARVVRRLGGEVRALYPAGGSVGQLLGRLVEAEGVSHVVVPIGGETREDVTVLDEASDQQYRFVLPGPELSEPEWRACLEALSALGPGPAIVCASGSLPPGAPEDFYARAAAIVRDWGALFVLDTSGPALKAALAAGVDLFKPNLRELNELVGARLDGPGQWLDACRALIARGEARTVALSLGADGALLVSREGAWRAPALDIEPLSTVGAGDSFLGALVWALADGRPMDEALRCAVAGGSAALLSPGTGLCHAVDLHRLIGAVRVEAVAAPALG
jgi:6-phosphofructokinase 2